MVSDLPVLLCLLVLELKLVCFWLFLLCRFLRLGISFLLCVVQALFIVLDGT